MHVCARSITLEATSKHTGWLIGYHGQTQLLEIVFSTLGLGADEYSAFSGF